MDNAQRLIISNGVEAMWYNASKFKKSVISVSMFIPLERERAALARLVSSIITQKTHKYKSYTELNGRLNELYGASISSESIALGDMQCITFRAVCLDDKYTDGEYVLSETADLLCEMLFDPVMTNGLFDNDAFESEKRLLVESIAAQLNDKRVYSMQRLYENMYKNEPCSVSAFGDKMIAESVTNEQAVETYRYMMKNAFVRINLLSAEKHDDVFENFKLHFDKIGRNVERIDVTKRHICENAQPNIISEHMDVTQGKLCMGFTVNAGKSLHDNAVLRVMCDIFGGGPYSLLFSNVREKQSLCYYCSARPNFAKGTISVSSGILPENYEKAYNGILTELDKLKNGEIDEGLLQISKKSLLDIYKSSVSDSLLSIDSWCFARTYQANDSLSVFLDEISKVTLEEVLNLAKTVRLDTVFSLGAKEERK